MTQNTDSLSGGWRRSLSAEVRGGIATLVSIAELLLLVLALGPFGSRAGAQEGMSTLLFTIPEHDLYPENVAFDPRSGDYFLGSMGQSRILRIHPDGSYEDFVSGLEPALQSSVGMKVDAERRLLWVCTGRFTLFGGASDGPSQTGVLLFDLDTGTLFRSWLMDQPSPSHFFNDLALGSGGEAYVSTTLLGKIFRISLDSDEMEPLLVTPETQTNGITLDPTDRYLFFTLGRSIARLDLQSGDLTEIPVPDEAGVGTDGMYFVDGSVVVVGHDLVFVATSFADVPRNEVSEDQHPDVLIYRLSLLP